MLPEHRTRIMGYFIEEALDHVNTIEQGLLNLHETIEDLELLNEVFRAAHSVKGGAAMLGLGGTQQIAHKLEDFFKVLQESPVRADERLVSLFMGVFNALRESIEVLSGEHEEEVDVRGAEIWSLVQPVVAELSSYLDSLRGGMVSIGAEGKGRSRTVAGVTEGESKTLELTPDAGSLVSGVRQHKSKTLELTTSLSPKESVFPRGEYPPTDGALLLVFKSDVPARLREMLQLFKQPDNATSREQLQQICRCLIQIGSSFDLPEWCSLCEAVSRAVANPQKTYRALGRVAIAEIVKAQELVLAGASAEIAVGAELQALLAYEEVTNLPHGAFPVREESPESGIGAKSDAQGEVSEKGEGNALPGLDVSLAEGGQKGDRSSEFTGFSRGKGATGSKDYAHPVLEVANNQPIIKPEYRESLVELEGAKMPGSSFVKKEVVEGVENAKATSTPDVVSDPGAVMPWGIQRESFDLLGDGSDEVLMAGNNSDLSGRSLNLEAQGRVTEGRSRKVEHGGPEVGAAELNTLADLFEGEASDLDASWSESEMEAKAIDDLMVNRNSENGDELPLDFSDLLFEESPQSPRGSGDTSDDLASLFGAFLSDEGEEGAIIDEQRGAVDSESGHKSKTLELNADSGIKESVVPKVSSVSGGQSDINDSDDLGEIFGEGAEDGFEWEILDSVEGSRSPVSQSDTFKVRERSEKGLQKPHDDEWAGLWSDDDATQAGEFESVWDEATTGAKGDEYTVESSESENLLGMENSLFGAQGLGADSEGQESLLLESSLGGDVEPQFFDDDDDDDEDEDDDDDDDFSSLFEENGGQSLSENAARLAGSDDAQLKFLQQDLADLFEDGESGFDGRLGEMSSDGGDEWMEGDSGELEDVFSALGGLFDEEHYGVLEEVGVSDRGVMEERNPRGASIGSDDGANAEMLLGDSSGLLADLFGSALDVGEDSESVEFLSGLGDRVSLVQSPEDWTDLQTLDAGVAGGDEPFVELKRSSISGLRENDGELIGSLEQSQDSGCRTGDSGSKGTRKDDGGTAAIATPKALDSPIPNAKSPFADLELLLNQGAPVTDFAELEALLGARVAFSAKSGADSSTSAVGDNGYPERRSVAAGQMLLDPQGELSLGEIGLGVSDLNSLVSGSGGFGSGDVGEADLSKDEFGDLMDLLHRGSEGITPVGARTAKVGAGAKGLEQTMRVSVRQLDNLSNLVGELVVNRNSLEQDQERMRQFLDNLLHQVQQLGDVGQRMQDLYERSLLEIALLASRSGYQFGFKSGGSGSNEDSSKGVSWNYLEMDRFTPFHTLSQEILELIVRVRESASDIEFLVDETEQVTRQLRQVTTQLQEGLTRSRMIPFAQTADRLYRLREYASELGKQVRLDIEGRETLIDKMILDQLYDPLTHLVNNALAHGIETPPEREKRGKAALGRITIRAFHQGNQTVISVSDDGAGIDAERVKAKAVQKGLLTPAEARSMSRMDVYDLLFKAGFSTNDKVDKLSGRGVGMDVVRTKLNEIRGVVSTDSTLGKGTTFTIRLPLALSISKALVCISDRSRIAFPMDGVEDMLDVPRDRIQVKEENQTFIPWRDTMLPFRPLRELLVYNRYLSRGSVYGSNAEEDIISVVVLRSAGNYLALQVDQVLGEQEIVIKQLEGPVPKPIGIGGATVMGDGRIVAIADVLELLDLAAGRVSGKGSGILWDENAQMIPEPQDEKTEPTVLIVDDSITVRELLSMTFNKAGYRVEQARDGQEAWEKLRSGLPCDIVFCDIEMPRMDGLELLSRMQKDPHLTELPIAMLTSRGADKHRQMAIQMGARGYFTKPYLEEALLEAAGRMLKGEVLVTAKAEA